MSQPRRSARIANRNTSKPDSNASKPLSKENKPLFDLGFKTNESLPTFYWDGQTTPSSDWEVEYKLFTEATDMKSPSALAGAIAHHEKIHKNDEWYAYQNSNSEWERELIVASRWLCIDNRILKESPEMYKKAEKYSFLVNASLPKLYAQINHFEEQLKTLTGYVANKIHRRLLMSNLLLTLAKHVHDKWNNLMNEINDEKYW